MTSEGVTLSLRDHFIVCAAGFMGASAGFALSGGNYLAAGVAGLYAAGVARSVVEDRIFGRSDYERPTVVNARAYLRDAPRTTVKKFNDAAVMCIATIGAGLAGAVLGYGMSAHFGLLAVPFGIAAGAGGGGFAGWVAGHVLRFPVMGAVSAAEAVLRTGQYLTGRKFAHDEGTMRAVP